MRDIKTIFIHCTATPQSHAGVDNRIVPPQGVEIPGYHYLILPQGGVTQLLDISEVSNGVQGHNANAINIAYIGGTDGDGRPADTRTIEQKAAIVHLLIQLRERFPKARIMGHRDIWSETDRRLWKKQCPCFNATKEYMYI